MYKLTWLVRTIASNEVCNSYWYFAITLGQTAGFSDWSAGNAVLSNAFLF